jgi:hypothetical protein
MDASSNPVKLLDYAPASKIPVRRIRRVILWAGAVIAVATIVFLWVPALYRYAEISYWARQCLNYSPPPNYLAYDCDFSKPSIPGHCNLNFAHKRFKELVDSSWVPFPTIFLHQVSRPDGQTRLVECSMGYTVAGLASLNFTGFSFDTGVWKPSASLMPWKSVSATQHTFDAVMAHLKIYVGTIDPTNASHFTIPLDIDGDRYIIDGWLKNDDSVLLSPITPVITPNPSAH